MAEKLGSVGRRVYEDKQVCFLLSTFSPAVQWQPFPPAPAFYPQKLEVW